MSNLLTVAEIAARLRKHHVTVRQMLQDGRLAPAYRIGRHWHMREAELEACMKNFVYHPTPARARRANRLIPKPEFVNLLRVKNEGELKDVAEHGQAEEKP